MSESKIERETHEATPVAPPADWAYAPAPESSDIVRIEDRYGLFIGGAFVEPKSDLRFPTINPATEEVLAMAAGADFIKTSTGKIGVSATLPNALALMEAARDFHRDTVRKVGVKVAGGVRTSKDAIGYLVLVHETLGTVWLSPELFRIGASSLLNDVLMQLEKERTGRYQSLDHFTID